MNNKKAIDRYHEYFEKQFAQISSIENPFYRKILLVVILDTLARAKPPQVKGNRDRFVQLITTCTDWKDHDRVSLPQLSLHLTATTSAQLSNKVNLLHSNWGLGQKYMLDRDPWTSELQSLAKTDVDRALIENCRHINLLYDYRCHLVHEFRQPGQGEEFNHDDNLPYYFNLNLCHPDLTSNAPKESRELVYPLGFFIDLAIASLKNLREYLYQNDLDPYSFYEFGTIWKH